MGLLDWLFNDSNDNDEDDVCSTCKGRGEVPAGGKFGGYKPCPECGVESSDNPGLFETGE